MKQLNKADVYNKLDTCKLENLDKALKQFIKEKRIISKQDKCDPIELEY